MASASTANCAQRRQRALAPRTRRVLGQRRAARRQQSGGLREAALAAQPQPQAVDRFRPTSTCAIGRRGARGSTASARVERRRRARRPARAPALRAASRQRAPPSPRAARARARDRRQRDEIEPVVLEHRLERPRIAAAQELEVPRRESRSPGTSPTRRHVEQHALERRQPAAALVPARRRPSRLATAAAPGAACRSAAPRRAASASGGTASASPSPARRTSCRCR